MKSKHVVSHASQHAQYQDPEIITPNWIAAMIKVINSTCAYAYAKWSINQVISLAVFVCQCFSRCPMLNLCFVGWTSAFNYSVPSDLCA